MGGLFSKEEKSKPLSYQNNSTYKREYQPTNTSYHAPNNFERLEISSPSIRKGKIEVSTNFERIWMKQRRSSPYTISTNQQARSSFQVPKLCERQFNIGKQSTYNNHNHSKKEVQISYDKIFFQNEPNPEVKKKANQLPSYWQPNFNMRYEKCVKIQSSSKKYQSYKFDQKIDLANVSIQSNPMNYKVKKECLYQSSCIQDNKNTNLITKINKLADSIKKLKNGALKQTQTKNNHEIDNILHPVYPSSKFQDPVFEIEQSYQDNNQSSLQQYQYFDFRQQKRVFKQFILKQMFRFKLSKKKCLLNTFESNSQYKNILIDLLKQEISSGINQKILDKKDISERDCLRVILSSRKSQHNFDKDKTIFIMKTRQEDEEQLQSQLLMGPCLGVITKSFPFKRKKLINHEDSTFICIINYLFTTKQIRVQGLQEVFQNKKTHYPRTNAHNNLEELIQNQFYFFDLTPLSTYQKQYIATQNIQLSPLLPVLLNNSIIAQPQEEIQERKRYLNIVNSKVYTQIVHKRNASQVAAIKNTFQRSAGIFLIQGPPGTGKTESIINLIALQYERNLKNRKNMKILVCAQSNAAVDNIARKIKQEGLIGMWIRPNILKLGCVDEVSDYGLQINLNHICETKLLEPINKDYIWSAKLRLLLDELTMQLKKARKFKQTFEKIKVIKTKLKQTQRQLTMNRQQIASRRQEYQRIQKEEIDKCQIFLSTLNTSGNYSTLEGMVNKISCLIIDEASQATQPSTLIPLLTKVRKMILVGDHKQLQPTVMSSLASHTMYNRSLFERMTDLGVKPYLLDIQYRMHPQLSRFPSDFFYEGRLKDGQCKDKAPQSLQNLASRALFVDLKTIRQEKQKNSKLNKLEAECIFTLIKLLVKLDSNLQIGVIAPYKAQINLLEQKVAQQFKNRKASVRVSTVDAFQGQEVDVVIFSCVRANGQNKIGFVSDPKRLNVAITRAKHALFIFGNYDTFNQDPTWQAYLKHHENSATIKIVDKIVSCKTLLIDHITGKTK